MILACKMWKKACPLLLLVRDIIQYVWSRCPYKNVAQCVVFTGFSVEDLIPLFLVPRGADGSRRKIESALCFS
jgi:hypothetical protein